MSFNNNNLMRIQYDDDEKQIIQQINHEYCFLILQKISSTISQYIFFY